MKKVCLIYGGNSNEHDVSCESMKFIVDNIDKKKYKLECVKITKNNLWIKDGHRIDNIVEFLKNYDVIFPIIHGYGGEDGKLQGMLELFNINYIGCDSKSSSICMDKARTKEILNNYDIPQVPYHIYKDKLKLEFPVIIKPANSGSSIGISIANNKKELKQALKLAKKSDNKIIIEKFIKTRELECAVLENKNYIISEIGEIVTNNVFYDYETKYKKNEAKTIIPADIPSNIKEKIHYLCKKIIEILEIKGLARIDFFYDGKSIYFNEVNTLPGFTKISMYPLLINDLGISNKEIITTLIENAKK